MFHRATPSFSFSILASRSPRRSSSPIRARTLVHCLAEPRMSWSLRQSFSQSFLMISTARVILGCTLSFLKRTFLVLCSPPATTWSQRIAIRGQGVRRHRCQVLTAWVPGDAVPTKSYLKILSHCPSLLTTQFPCWLIANLQFNHFNINLTDQVHPFRFALVRWVEGKFFWGGCKENPPSNALLSCHCTPREGARSRNLLATRRPISSRPPPCTCSTSQEGTRLAWETFPPPALGTDFGATAAVANVVVVSQVNVEN